MLYLLERIGEVGWDEVNSLVVRADNEELARLIAADVHGDEGMEVWMKDTSSTCVPIELNGRNGVLCRDYNAG